MVRPALLAAALALLLFAPDAGAHAALQSSSPTRADQVERAPERVTLRFDEPVEAAFGSIRVYDARGKRVERGTTEQPGGRSDEIAVDLIDGLDEGIYTATYRVISADSHPVTGGYVFTVGAGAGAPRASVDELIEGGSAGPIAEVAFGLTRALGYLALALGAGGFVFALAVRAPSLRETGSTVGGDAWQAASEAFAGRARVILLTAAGLGVASSALGIVLQGATAAATSFWSALDPQVIGDVLQTRFGTVWGLRLGAWTLFGALVALVALPAGRAAAAVTGLLAAFLCLTPALAGHASTLQPTALLVPANALHVVSMAIWVGGVLTLLAGLPVATRRLPPAQRTALLAAAVARFSTVAVFAVAVLLASGALQAFLELDALSDLWRSAFGRAIVVKATLAVCLVALGAWNRSRARPRLARLAAQGAPPGRTGGLLRRALVSEVALMAGVLAATAALASYAPPSPASGPFSISEGLGPARMELTLDPARPGANELHLYLFDRRDGSQYDRVEELDLRARLPDQGIGPIELRAEQAGPSHYVVRRADISPAGDWTLDVSARVSEFDAYQTEIEVPVK